MRKPTICICENKDADQLRGNREADQRLCFRYLDSKIPLLPKSKISSLISSGCTTWFVSDLVKIHIVGFLTLRLILINSPLKLLCGWLLYPQLWKRGEHIVKPVLYGHSKDKRKDFQDWLSLMQVKSIAECSRPALSYHPLSWRPSFYLFLNGRLRQVWLFCYACASFC